MAYKHIHAFKPICCCPVCVEFTPPVKSFLSLLFQVNFQGQKIQNYNMSNVWIVYKKFLLLVLCFIVPQTMRVNSMTFS